MFVIELLASNRTLYKPCGRHAPPPRNASTREEQGVVEITCSPGDTRGHFVFVRDDRKVEEELVLCEVEVFGVVQGAGEECGEPELAAGAVLEGGRESHRGRVRCRGELELGGGGEAAEIWCRHGSWNSSMVRCSAPPCPAPPRVEGAQVEMVGRRALYTCATGTVLWGAALTCTEGRWRGAPPTCSPLSCGPPPAVAHATHSSSNSSFLVGEEVVYTCSLGFLMVVNSSTSPVAREQAVAGCGEEGEWSDTAHLSCVDASHLGSSTWIATASLSINIIYILLALLTLLTLPLLLLHCCGHRLCSLCSR